MYTSVYLCWDVFVWGGMYECVCMFCVYMLCVVCVVYVAFVGSALCHPYFSSSARAFLSFQLVF